MNLYCLALYLRVLKAAVKPLLKKSNLDPEEPKNYRPVSNLTFLSKILEKIVLTQIESHLSVTRLRETFQSAYRSGHSTETSLLRVTSDLLKATDDGHVSVLALLDLSAAFDTIDHDILITRLSKSFGIRGTALAWLSSYLTNRQQKVVIRAVESAPVFLKFGVPQGSVLGPMLFTLYSQSVSHVISKYCFNYHLYADDTQLYKSVPVHNVPTMLADLCKCTSSIKKWMTDNKLKMNGEKTEIMLVGSQFKLSQLNVQDVNIDNENIQLSNSLKNLGVLFDPQLSMDKAISHVRKLCYLEMRKISHIRPFVDEEITKKLILSFVMSRIDYCNSLLSGISEERLKKLQRIQNQAVKLVKKLPKRSSVTSSLNEFHWLPIRSRIKYKTAVFTYKCLNDSDFPDYLKELISIYEPSRNLRSMNKHLLTVPRTKLKNFGQRSFLFNAPSTWNSLPEFLKTSKTLPLFKKNLKTFLFAQP